MKRHSPRPGRLAGGSISFLFLLLLAGSALAAPRAPRDVRRHDLD